MRDMLLVTARALRSCDEALVRVAPNPLARNDHPSNVFLNQFHSL